MYLDGTYLGIYIFYILGGLVVLYLAGAFIHAMILEYKERKEERERDKREMRRLKRERNYLANEVEYLNLLLDLNEKTGAYAPALFLV